MLDGPGRGLGHPRGHVSGPVAWKHCARGPRGRSAAQEGTDVAGIGDAVEDEQEGRSRPAGRAQLVQVRLREGLGVGQDALGGFGAGLGLEPGAGHAAQRDPTLPGQGGDVVEQRCGLDALRQIRS